MKYETAIATEKAEGFDRTVAEDAIDAYMTSKLGGSFAFFESANPGVLAMERPDYNDSERIDWDELAARLKEATGVKVACVAQCEWSFDDRCDEEAVFIAFDIPSLPEDYADDSRDLLTAEDDPAPTLG